MQIQSKNHLMVAVSDNTIVARFCPMGQICLFSKTELGYLKSCLTTPNPTTTVPPPTSTTLPAPIVLHWLAYTSLALLGVLVLLGITFITSPIVEEISGGYPEVRVIPVRKEGIFKFLVALQLSFICITTAASPLIVGQAML